MSASPAPTPEVAPSARPRTRGDCVDGPRPCPWQGCRFHLVEVRRPRRRAPDAPTCALDLADRGAATLEEIGAAMGLTRERIRQIQGRALENFRIAARRLR